MTSGNRQLYRNEENKMAAAENGIKRWKTFTAESTRGYQATRLQPLEDNMVLGSLLGGSFALFDGEIFFIFLNIIVWIKIDSRLVIILETWEMNSFDTIVITFVTFHCNL